MYDECNQTCLGSDADVVYHRIPISDECAPEERDFDDFVNTMREQVEVFTSREQSDVGLIFNCQMRRGRTTTGIVMACLMIGVKCGFPKTKNKVHRVDDSHRDGNFIVIREAVEMLRNGEEAKKALDIVIDVAFQAMVRSR